MPLPPDLGNVHTSFVLVYLCAFVYPSLSKVTVDFKVVQHQRWFTCP